MKIIRLGLWGVLFTLLFILGLPKQKLFYTLEHILKEHHLYISQEILTSNLFDLKIEKARFLLDSIPLGTVEQARIYWTLLQNQIFLKEVQLHTHSLFPSLPQKIDHIKLTHTLFSPHMISLQAYSQEAGTLKGDLNLFSNTLVIFFKPNPDKVTHFSSLIHHFSLTKEGIYRYEQPFTLFK